MAGGVGMLLFVYQNANRLIVPLTLQFVVIAYCVVVEEELFTDFLRKYPRNYTNDNVEYAYRYAVFQETLRRIERLNNVHPKNSSVFYGITQYADMTPEEFRSKVLKHHKKSERVEIPKHVRRKRSMRYTLTKQQPSKFDWRDQKVVTPVKNQGDCGACWAFSTVETVETMYALKTGQLPELSVQQVIDCATNGNYGCQGGDTCATLAWMNSTRVHIVSEKEYPFNHATGVCKDKNPPHGVQVQGFTCIDYLNNENRMVDLIATHGPLVVAVDATMWQDYLGGIIKYHCEATHNHAVQIVGYDLTGSVPYYIVRNSWGANFGLNGYLHIAIGKNLCGIAREVATVDV